MTPALKIAIGSVVVGIVVLGIKYLSYTMTGSVALLSDAMESIVNVVTAIAAFVAIRIAALPEDKNHPYGHHKAEFLSAVIEGVMIIIAAFLILIEAYDAFFTPHMMQAPYAGLGVNIIASIINGAWCWVLLRRGRALRSPALVADGHHLLSDVISSVGVTVGVLLAAITGWAVLDPLLAVFVAINILWSGSKVIQSSVSGLMDAALPPDTVKQIEAIIAEHGSGAVQAHDLRTRTAGNLTFIEFHLVVPGSMTVNASHALCDRIEAALREHTPNLRINIHVEPMEKAKDAAIEILQVDQ